MTDESTPKVDTGKTDDMPKLKILAFHGYGQNGETFKVKLGAFRKLVRRYATVTCLTAPHIIETDSKSTDEETVTDPRGWWFNAEDCTFKATRVSSLALGFDNTLKFIKETFEKHGPFDGLLGFSQGASLVAMLAAMQQKELLPYNFKFVIVSSGFCSGSLVHRGFYDENILLPSLHIYGETDEIIPKEMSETLAVLFDNPFTYEHKGGHYLACSGSAKNIYKDFLLSVIDETKKNKNQ